MSNIQLEAFGEPFNSTAALERFRNHVFTCPFDSRIPSCDKPNRGDLRYGNCSAKVGSYKRIICPRRFYEGNYKILKEAKDFIWGNDVQTNAYDEVKLQTRTSSGDQFDYGTMDWILVPRNITDEFDLIGVEIQTDATTGTGEFRNAITDLLSNNLQTHYGFGLNTLASFKGFLPQFIFKGQLFDDWKKPYVAVIQDELWNLFKSKFRIRYRRITHYTTETFIFFVYKLTYVPSTGKHIIERSDIYGTRWIDLLFAFAVENELLIDYTQARQIIERKIRNYDPRLTL